MILRLVPLLILSALCIAICAPHALATTEHFEYFFPRPDAQLVSRETTIILRSTDALAKRGVDWHSSITVRGAISGPHEGRWTIADDGETFLFRPRIPFAPSEVVTVDVDTKVAGYPPHSFTFTVSPKPVGWAPNLGESLDSCSDTPVSHLGEQLPHSPKGPVVWPADLPTMTVTILDNPDDGYVFLTTRRTPGNPRVPPYNLIVDNNATPIFFEQIRGSVFRPWPGDVLTYNASDLVPILDNTYTRVGEYNVFRMDGHDFRLLPNGHALVFLRDPQPVDMSLHVEGGDPNAVVTGCIVHEIDASSNIVFEWRSWDHYEITDCVIDLTTPTVDLVHCNTIEQDTDGNIMIIALNLLEITKINRQTGDIMWRLGQGFKNEFTIVGEPEFGWGHHDLRRLPNGNITIYNNRTYTTQEARAVEYSLDEVNKVATMVWEFRNSPGIAGGPWGGVQRLPNGNTMISWGATGLITEVRPDGTKAFEMQLAAGQGTYRAYRFPWSAVAAQPTLWGDAAIDAVTLHFTKFGDPNVAQYHIYQGLAPDPTTLVASTTENSVVVGPLEPNTYYFRVTAEDPQQVESPFSNEVEFTIEPPVAVVSMMLEGRDDEDGIHLTWQISHGHRLGHLQILRARAEEPLTPLVHLENAVGNSATEWTDREAVPGTTYRYQMIADIDGETLKSNEITIDRTAVRRLASRLVGAAPNPFNPNTRIDFELAEIGVVRIQIHDLAGRLVRTLDLGQRQAGTGSVQWDAKDNRGRPLASGVYLARLVTPVSQSELKLTLLK